jgi:hypothetical protein
VIWKVVVFSFLLIGNWLVWKVKNETRMRLGEDPWFGCGENYVLSRNMVSSLEMGGIIFLFQVADLDSTTVWR